MRTSNNGKIQCLNWPSLVGEGCSSRTELLSTEFLTEGGSMKIPKQLRLLTRKILLSTNRKWGTISKDKTHTIY